MRAVLVDDSGSMSWGEAETPSPGAGEVLIRVAATAINRADLMQRRGMYPPPPGASSIIGLECAGIVEAIGEGVRGLASGMPVCALLAGGGYAEYAVAPATSVLPVPQGLSFTEAASLPEVYATAWLNLFMEAGLAEGERVVLYAGASGVGTAGIQLCKAFGSPCFVTAGADDKIERCLELGADAGANRHGEGMWDAAREFAGDTGVDVILDPVSGGYFDENLKLLGLGGRLVLIGLMSGARTEANLALLMTKRLRVIGSTLRARPNAEKGAVMGQLRDRVWPAIASGTIKPVIEKVYPIAEVEDAYALVESDATFGKVVLEVDSTLTA
ncbi:MAG: NAD(P)H-quinone oxidoreductase [Gammaproteobacteria bacterium]|nr:NAD(P)H-quinone oxidoreductase [Gammaproteobacteria bacterium]